MSSKVMNKDQVQFCLVSYKVSSNKRYHDLSNSKIIWHTAEQQFKSGTTPTPIPETYRLISPPNYEISFDARVFIQYLTYFADRI